MRGAVVAPEPRAVEVGAGIMLAGGNAFDAAVATAFAQMIADPWMCGVAGHGTAIMRTAGNEYQVIEFSSTAGSRVREDMWAGQSIGRAKISASVLFDDYRNELGYTAVCTPGTLKALWEIHGSFGTMPWAELLAPAIAMARGGFRIPPYVERFWAIKREKGIAQGKQRMGATPASAALYLKPNGDVLEVGDLLVLSDFANTLEAIARGGAEEFYQGEIAHRIAEDMAANGGFITLEDLKNYRTRKFQPLWGEYRGHQVVTPPPPVSGVILLEILNILSGYDLGSMVHNGAEYLHLMTSAMKLAHRDRRRYLGDPEYVQVPLDYMLSLDTAAKYREQIAAGDIPQKDDWRIAHGHTTHVSVYDEEGNCVAITHSLGTGSGAVTPGLGFVYNNDMKHFDPEPGGPNSIKPGKSRIRGSCPSILLSDGKPRLVVGAPGGSVIISSVLQTILNIVDFGMTASDAVSAARIHCEGGAVFTEARILSPVVRALEAKGHQVDYLVDSFARLMSAPEAIHIPPDGGRVQAGADPRWGAGAAFSLGNEVASHGWIPEA